MANLVEQTVEELKKIISFKDTTEVGDVILIVNETPDEDGPLGMAYARINEFEPDNSKRDEWWFVHMTFLTVPPRHQMLILQNQHFTGQEIFTIGGKKVFIKALDFSNYRKDDDTITPETDKQETSKPKEKNGRAGLRVVK